MQPLQQCNSTGTPLWDTASHDAANAGVREPTAQPQCPPLPLPGRRALPDHTTYIPYELCAASAFLHKHCMQQSPPPHTLVPGTTWTSHLPPFLSLFDPFSPPPHRHGSLTIRLPGDEASDVLNFVLKDDATNTWYDNMGSNFAVSLRAPVQAAPGAVKAPQVPSQLPRALCDTWAWIKWDHAGKGLGVGWGCGWGWGGDFCGVYLLGGGEGWTCVGFRGGGVRDLGGGIK